MLVRPATPEDAHDILDLHVASIRAFGPDAYTDAQVDAWATVPDGAPGYPIDEAGQYYVVCERAGTLAGFGHLTNEAAEYGTDAAVEAVYVHPDHTRCGVGSAILAHLEGYARGQGHGSLALWASLNAVAFYEAAGWERVGERTHETSGAELTVVEMERHLG
jgi:putative acetyltransferase